MSAAVILLLLLCCSLTSEARPTPVHDYLFNVTGVVRTAEGTPVQDSRVTLQLMGAAHHGETPDKTVNVNPDRLGGFSFNFFVIREQGTKYTLSVHKEGFESKTVTGSSPPPQSQIIQ